MKANSAMELLVYMVTSAAGLQGEPEAYGPLRLIEASKRLALMLAEEDADRAAALQELAQLIDERKNDCMTDEDSFYAMLNDAAAKLVECV
ncbi:DUF6092 family protein [Paraeggerthella hongkongensis]|nr:DUF6092 family protein [Paraeggerthella hongkongensis]